MSKSNEAFSDAAEQGNAVSQQATDGERGGAGGRPSRLAMARANYRAGKTISLDELKRRVLGT